MELRTGCLLLLAGALVGGAGVRYAWPSVVTKTETQEVIKDRVVTVTHTVERPDGTKETNTRITDTSVTKRDTVAQVAASKPQWHVSATVTKDVKDLVPNIYGVSVQRRLVGPVFGGVVADTSGHVGVTFGFEF